MKSIRFIASIVAVLACLTSLRALAADGRFAYLAYGDLRGHIEPCGCDPATDLGGIKRLGALLARERAAMPGLLVFGLGNNLPYAEELAKAPSASVKADYILEAEAANGVSAILLNETELAELARIEKSAKKISYVLSNVRPGSKAAKLSARDVKHGDTVIFGYTYADAVKGELQAIDAKLVDAWRNAKKKSGAARAVLLFSGPEAHLETLASVGLFDEIVSSNTKPRTAEAATDEKLDEAKLIRRRTPLVRMVPLAGQGVLRGGAAQTSEAPTVAEIFKNDQGNSPFGGTQMKTAEAQLFGAAKAVTWLDAGQGSTKELDQLYARYDGAVKKSFAQANAARIKDLAATPYAGADACKSCHANAYRVWQGSKHAHAMKTLQDKNKHEDPECVACHSVGSNEKGGFVSLVASPQFADVQCENCHGAALAHTKNPAHDKPLHGKGGVPASCVGCHNTQHSPSFEAKSYWQKIQHGRS